MAIQMRRGNLADFDPTKQMPGEFAVTLDTDSNLNKRVYIAFAAGTVKQLMTVEDATAQMIEATDAATAEAEAWAHGNSFTATEMFTSAGSATVTLAYSPSSINAVKINDVATTAYTRNGKVITFNTAPAVGSTITVIYGVSTSTDNAKYYKGQAANSASTASTKATQASTSATNAANSASTASTKATQAGNSATLSESYAVGGTGTRPGEDTDNAKYYKDQMAAYLSGIYHFIGSVNTYADLPTMGMVRGDTYDILTADPTHEIAAGDNVAWTGTKWDKLSGTIATMIGATASSNGAKGLVPAPMIADKDNFLRGDGTWANPNTAVDDVYSVMGYMGAKNLIPRPYADGEEKSQNNMTYTVNTDGTITATATQALTNDATFYLYGPTDTEELVLKAGVKYVLSGDPTASGVERIVVAGRSAAGGTSEMLIINNSGVPKEYTPDVDKVITSIYIRIYAGPSSPIPYNQTFKPMLRLAADTDNTYQPYAKTNKQLTDDKAEVVSVRDYVNEFGVKNLLVPEWTETHTTENGVTYTFNADGTIIMNTDASGATANTNCNLRQNTVSTNNVFPAGSYTFTGCPAGGSSTKYRTWLRAYRPNTNTALTDNLFEEGNGVSFTVSEPFSLGINATVRSGYVCNNLTWKPMLRIASDINDDTYVPFAMTNKQLTDGLDTTKGQISDLTTKKVNTWMPDVYDFDTKVKTLDPSICNTYVQKIGDLTVAYLGVDSGTNLGSFSTMMQLRGFPEGCTRCIGGYIYNSSLESSPRVVQASNVGVYFRPNITGSMGSGFVSALLFFN